MPRVRVPPRRSPPVIHVCAVQLDPALGRRSENAERVADEIVAAGAEGADLAVFPEAALTGYVFEDPDEVLDAAVRADGPELAELGEVCASAGTRAVVGAIERDDDVADGPALFNAAFVLGPEGTLGRYRKLHTLCLGADRFTRPGDDGLGVFDLPIGRIGVHICYDGSFPETPRALRLAGARLLLLPTNWPELSMKPEMVRVRAYENHAFYLAVNRTGTERGVTFEGGSCAADPFGEPLLSAGPEAGRHHVEMELERARSSRVTVFPGRYEYDRIADRRPDLYGPLVIPPSGGGPTGSRRSGGPKVT